MASSPRRYSGSYGRRRYITQVRTGDRCSCCHEGKDPAHTGKHCNTACAPVGHSDVQCTTNQLSKLLASSTSKTAKSEFPPGPPTPAAHTQTLNPKLTLVPLLWASGLLPPRRCKVSRTASGFIQLPAPDCDGRSCKHGFTS